MSVGEIINPFPRSRLPVAAPNRIGPRLAMAEALEAYLMGLEFCIDGGEGALYNTAFSLNEVLREFPGPEDTLRYPTASIIETTPTDYGAHNFVPTPLEETIGQFDAFAEPALRPTVLWKEAEAMTMFQLDFWADGTAERQAISGALSAAFNPNDSESGVRVRGPELYYGTPVRLTLLTSVFVDLPDAVYANERRLRCAVRAESDIVSLRRASLLTVTAPCVTVIDPTDPPALPSEIES